MTTETALELLAVATALHAGFQITVTSVVYPALARVPAEHWDVNHQAHSRLITPVVVLTYGALLAAVAAVLLTVGLGAAGGWVLLALVASGVALVVTALLAAPAHGRLADGKQDDVVRRLLWADRVRALASLVAAVAALFALG